MEADTLPLQPFALSPFHVVLAVAVAAITAALFLSGILTHPAGIIDGFRAFTPWVGRAGGTGLHKHPWSYYLGILTYVRRAQGPVWSEALILGLAVVGGLAAFTPWSRRLSVSGRALARFLVFYTIILTVAYSAIPYKTPWCVLSFLTGMALLGGIGVAALVDWIPGTPLKTLLVLALGAGMAQLGWQAYRTCFLYPTDNRNPYVYAQTVPDIADFQTRMRQLAESGPQKLKTVVEVVSGDNYYWPMPWYLRELANVGYFTSVPPPPYASIIIASPQFDDELTKKLDPTHLMTGYYGLRPGTVYEVWVSMELWKAYLAAHPHKAED